MSTKEPKGLKKYLLEDLDKFLDSIDHDKRLAEGRYFTKEEVARIMYGKLQEYEEGKVSFEFVTNLAGILQHDTMEDAPPNQPYDEELTGILCDIDSLRWEADKKLHQLMKQLERKIKYG